ncbi:NAD(P)/FAD-dependent oxidoreductase [Plantactinospora sp. KBS50]|uniref:FAD-dependent oxidoreductase n=1 Tax=Plantactinospora sp. KBS50 TaxID=2024580 RepID=UPI001E55CC39|nr:NAD(P)/FAD-dependent oxidoreductase [Plantactinospora sp. KBS50]
MYEAYPSITDGPGGTLALAPNGVAALRLVGADEAVTAGATPIEHTAMVIGRGRIDLPSLAGVPPLRVVHRNDVHRALHERATAAGLPIEHGRRLVAVHQTGTGVTAEFADGGTASADILVGADGIHSTVRRIIDPNAPQPRHTGVLGFESVAAHRVDVPAGTMTFTFGAGGYYLYWPEPGGGTRWGVNLPQDRPMSLTEARAVPAREWTRRLLAAYGADDPARDLLRTSDPDALQVSGSLHIMPPVPHWHRDRMVLVGDAVHAPSNSSGQGASLAVESAVQLARCLRDLPDVRSAFEAYEGLRRTRVEAIAARAAKINRTKAPGPLARAVLPVLMRVMAKTAMNPEKTLGPQQRYTIDWAAPVSEPTVPA